MILHTLHVVFFEAPDISIISDSGGAGNAIDCMIREQVLKKIERLDVGQS